MPGPSGAPYCTPTDLGNYLPQATIDLASPAQQTQACLDATEEADSYMRGRFAMPLLAWGNDVRKYTAWIACYNIASMLGFPPTQGADDQITRRYHMAVGDPSKPGTGWFPGIQRQSIHPDVTPTIAQPGDPVHDIPQVRSAQPRGWQQTRNGKPVIS
jgi:hypothetical protein